jgi:hypothetical protein
MSVITGSPDESRRRHRSHRDRGKAAAEGKGAVEISRRDIFDSLTPNPAPRCGRAREVTIALGCRTANLTSPEGTGVPTVLCLILKSKQ